MKKYLKYITLFVLPILVLTSCQESEVPRLANDLYNLKKETVNVSADQNSLNFDSQAHFADIQFESNFWWRLDTVLVSSVDPAIIPLEANNWFSVAPTQNFGNRPVTITLTRNMEKCDRKIILKFFSENGTQVKELELIQKASIPVVEVIPVKTDFSLLTNTLKVDLTTTENWSVKLPSWCTSTIMSGTKCRNNIVNIQLQKNNTKQERKDTIKFVGGGITKSFVIIQAGVFEKPKDVKVSNGEKLLVQWVRSTGSIAYKINYYEPGTNNLIDTCAVPVVLSYPENISFDISSVATWKNYVGDVDISISATLGENIWEESVERIHTNTCFGESTGSDGTQEKPFVIKAVRHFINVSKKSGSYFIQAADLDMTGVTNYVPINNFTGVYEGNNFAISKLTMNPAVNTPYGIWGIVTGVNAIIRNLKFINCSMNITQPVFPNEIGLVAGRLEKGTIDNCESIGYQLNTTKSSNVGVGGIVGYNTMGSVTNCRTYSGLMTSVQSFDPAGLITNAKMASPVFGGIVGRNGASLNTDPISLVENCINYDLKIIGGGSRTGGIVGENNFAIRNCINYATIRAVTHLGGIAGGASSVNNGAAANFLIEYCANWGSIYNESAGSNAQVGGIVGRGGVGIFGTLLPTIRRCFNAGNITMNKILNASQLPINIGGIGGILNNMIVQDCYNVGNISSVVAGIQSDAAGSIVLGGIVGSFGAGTFTNCYSSGKVNGSAFYNGLFTGRKTGAPAASNAVNCYTLLQEGYKINGWVGTTAAGTDPIGLNATQMLDPTQFIGFDFDLVWQINSSINNGYPTLKGLNATASKAVRKR